MSRLLASIALLFVCAGDIGATDWKTYRASHIQEDGRVIDRQNNAITHTEGIGYALFFAACMKDEETFQRIESWLEHNLPKNDQGLYPWKWGDNAKGQWGVLDTNNAADGDLWIAYARLKAAKVFGRDEYRTRALSHIEAIQTHLLLEENGRLFLLPGYHGFRSAEGILLNPSYYIPFIFETFYRATSDERWRRLIEEGMHILAHRYSHYALHPDWILYTPAGYALPPSRPRFSYDAIRIPLFWSVWYALSKNPEIPGTLEGYRALLSLPFFPIWIDLSNDSMSLLPDSSGTMSASLRFYSIISRLPMREVENNRYEKNITYFGDSIAMFGALPLECYRE